MEDNIKTRPDGSIDIQHYMHRGNEERSKQAHSLFGWVATIFTRARPATGFDARRSHKVPNPAQ